MLRPTATATRELLNLDGLWRFGIEGAVGERPWAAPLTGRLEAPVPASYNDLFVDPAIRDHVGWVWYQRTVRVPRGWAGERILLRIEAATHAGVVYADDTKVAEHVGGYTPFDADLTGVVEAGGEFRLTIGVDNRLTEATIPPGTVTTAPDGRRRQAVLHDFTNFAGLARSVWLHSTPVQHVEDVRVVTDVHGADGIVTFDVGVAGEGAAVRVRLLDEPGAEVASGEGASGRLHVAGATLWQPGAAYLYELQVELVEGGAVVDSVSVPVGIRTVEVRGAQFLINGEPFYFTGFGKHEDTPVRGKGHDPAYLVHDFQLLEWIGANSFRTSHYPYAEEVLDHADRHGVVVIAETAAVGLNLALVAGVTGQRARPTFTEETVGSASRSALLQHLREVVERDRNHPSVVMWSLANEPASHEDGAREYFEPVVELARALDPTRPITYANVFLATPDVDRIADLFDVLCLNRYYGWYVDTGDLASAERRLEAELRAWERYGKPVMMTEYGADTVPGLHSVWDMPWTEEYQSDLLAMYHRVFDRIPSFVGEQVWNFADFQTGPGIHRVDGNRKGVFTRDRHPKAAAHTLRARWTRIGSRKPAAD